MSTRQKRVSGQTHPQMWCKRHVQRTAILAAFLSIGTTLFGCGMGPRPHEWTQASLPGITDDQLCIGWYVTPAAEKAQLHMIFEELKKRRLIRAKTWRAAEKGQVMVGMNECELLAAKGEAYPKTRMQTALGTTENWDYSSMSVYLSDGFVSSIFEH